MTTNLPPQAYTRDTLVKAIEWLHTQPPTVRERATSADLLVNIYLQARRRAAVQMEAPVSGETFKTDLKHLAEDLKQFEEPTAPPQGYVGRSPSNGSFDMHGQVEPLFKPAQAIETPLMQAMAAAPHHTQHTQHHAQTVHAPAQTHMPSQAPVHAPLHTQTAQTHAAPGSHAAPAQGHAPQAQHKPGTWHVDARSLAGAREIQQRFNLSSEGEALRMLITLGLERARDLFP